MTIKQFFENEKKLAIHCDTKEKAKALCNAFDREGYTWRSGSIRYKECTYWNFYMRETCYDNGGHYGSREFYEGAYYRVIEFENIEITEPTIDLSQVTTDTLLEELKRRVK